MKNFRVGVGYDIHQLKNNNKLILGGVLIPHYKGTVAHSDGDVVIHAICDALLGAAGLGDIGHFFPDNDDKFKLNIYPTTIEHLSHIYRSTI